MKKKRNRIIALIIVITMLITLIAGVAMTAFSAIAAPVRDKSGLEIGQTSILYDNSNGLPTSEANAIVQTEDGFIWIGSYSGLVRYDGSQFERIDSAEGIASVVSLYVDTKERLWVGTNDSGVAMLGAEGGFRFFSRKEGLSSLSIRGIAEDKDGNIILATTEGLYRIDSENKVTTVGEDKLGHEYIQSIIGDIDGVIYGLTADGKAFYVKDGMVSDFYSGKDMGVSDFECIYADPRKKGYVYLGTQDGEIVSGNMQQGMNDIFSFNVDGIININCIRFIDELMWFGADNGTGYFDDNNKVTVLQNMPMTFSIDDITSDYEGNIWFASSRQGVMEITETKFKDISRSADLPQTVVNTTCLHDGLLYLGCDTGLIIVKDQSKVVENELTKMLDTKRIRAIKESKNGDLWICTYSEYGLICVHKDGSIDTFNTENGLLSERIRTITELSDGTLVGSSSEGLFFINDGKVTKTMSESDGLDSLEILTICEGENGELYLGSDGNGLYILKGDNIKRLGFEDGLKSEVILRFKKDTVREGLYWIITSNSIAYMKDGVITSVDNFPYANNFDIFFGNGDDVWVLCSAGVYRANAKGMLANEKIEYTFYGKDNGMPVVSTANSRNYIDESGDLYVSGTTGVALINIFDNFDSGEQVKLAVPYISVGNDRYFVEKTKGGKYTVTIPKSARRIAINAFALTYKLINPLVSYELEGFDDEATYVKKQEMSPISYTNLRGGNYTFTMSTVDINSREPLSTIEVTIKKPRMFYEMLGFWIAVFVAFGLILAVIVSAIIKRRLAKSEKKQRETKEFLDTVIRAFAKCIDFKDRYTNGHSFRVAKYTKLLAEKMGFDEERVSKMYNIALLHDIGKITIPDEILNKPTGLTDEEYEIMKGHAENGESILEEIKADPELSIGAGYHHERLDGKGYPRGVNGNDIPMVAQIIAVADTFDAMYSTRTYSKKRELKDVIAELRRVGGTQLNKEIVEHLVELAEEGALGAENVK